MKVKTITLSHPHANPNSMPGVDPLYRVEKVTDSLEFQPGEFLAKKAVQPLCASNEWKVTIVAPK